MRLLSLISRTPSPLLASAVPAEPSAPGIDIPAAIQAHVLWKLRLQNYINGKGEALDAAVVGCDCDCVLGHWIHSEGEEVYGPHPTFREVKAIHAEFHRRAGEVVRAVDNGDRPGAQAILGAQEFLKASEQIKKKLASLFLEFDF